VRLAGKCASCPTAARRSERELVCERRIPAGRRGRMGTGARQRALEARMAELAAESARAGAVLGARPHRRRHPPLSKAPPCSGQVLSGAAAATTRQVAAARRPPAGWVSRGGPHSTRTPADPTSLSLSRERGARARDTGPERNESPSPRARSNEGRVLRPTNRRDFTRKGPRPGPPIPPLARGVSTRRLSAAVSCRL
jgi:hypothetical protein